MNVQEFDATQYQTNLASLAGGKLDRYNRAAAAEAPYALSLHHQDSSERYPHEYHAQASKHKVEVQGKVSMNTI